MDKFTKLALCLGLATATATASADQNGWYAGVGVGQSAISDWLSSGETLEALDAARQELGMQVLDATTSAGSDDGDTGWKLFVGYDLGDNLAIEASYLDFGEATAHAATEGDFLVGSTVFSASGFTKITGEASAFTLDGVASFELAPWLDLFARVGLYRAEMDISVSAGLSDGITSATASDSFDDTTNGLHVGLGADFTLSEQVVIRAEWERLANVDFDESETDIDLLSISAFYRF